MSKTSIADAIVAWENALANARTSATEVPGIESYTGPLEQTLTDAKALTARLETRKAVKQQDSQDRKALMKKGNVQVSRIRSAVRAFFGPNSERLIEFGARPVRPRTGKSTQKVKPQTPPSGAAAKTEKEDPGKENEAPRNPTAP
jgi:hypothetical protein